MKSKLKFDLTEQNDPCIIAEISHDTEDLRDKVAKRFIEELGYDSNILRLTYIPSDNSVSRCLIQPVSELSIISPNSDRFRINLAKFIESEVKDRLAKVNLTHLNFEFDVKDLDYTYAYFLYDPSIQSRNDGYVSYSTNFMQIIQLIEDDIQYILTKAI